MKVISIMQPWATLIALGEKEFETRSWKTKYRGELAIHSSKKIDKEACKIPPISRTLKKHGFHDINALPTGQILATCNLDECLEVISDKGGFAILGRESLHVSGNEYYFGDFREGRFGWKLSNVKLMDNPIAAKGQLGLWNFAFTNKVGNV